MGDTISRQAATGALRKMQTYKMLEGDDVLLIDQAGAMTELMLLQPAEPEVIRCKDCKHREYYRKSGYMCRLDTGDPYMTGRNAEDDDWFCADAEMR